MGCARTRDGGSAAFAGHVGAASPHLNDSLPRLRRVCVNGTEGTCRWDTPGDGHRRIMPKHQDWV